MVNDDEKTSVTRPLPIVAISPIMMSLPGAIIGATFLNANLVKDLNDRHSPSPEVVKLRLYGLNEIIS